MPDAAYAVALASVPGIGPKTLRALLERATPQAAWEEVLGGGVHIPASPNAASAPDRARKIDVAAMWRSHVDAGVGVCVLGEPAYPAVLAADPEAPAVLFFLGRPRALDDAPRVAIVGTRSATRYGLGVAAQLGADLAAAGVVVVSGLALGIDGAAHEGAVAAWRAARSGGDASGGKAQPGGLHGEGRADDRGPVENEQGAGGAGRSAPPVGVVAGSVAAPYPRQHAGLWRRVAQAGAVISESPIGAADLAWRFPARNRIIAALSDVVVVVECHSRGGSLHTVHAANARGVPVGAVPGSVRSPASAGTNTLLADGCFVVRDASDVLVAIGLSLVSARSSVSRIQETPNDGTEDPPSSTREVISAVGWERVSLDDILERTGLAMDVACAALERLSARGKVQGEGGWWERA